jgi:PadR family transcriptional regulator, regulatory protein PadR
VRSKQNHNLDLSPLEEIILIALGGRQLYGLEIVRAVEEASEGKRKVGFGSLYPTLHKLQNKGLVRSQWGDEKPEERGGARRRYYETTALGRRAVKELEQIRNNVAAWKPAWGRA